jgi:hypothetical protein
MGTADYSRWNGGESAPCYFLGQRGQDLALEHLAPASKTPRSVFYREFRTHLQACKAVRVAGEDFVKSPATTQQVPPQG